MFYKIITHGNCQYKIEATLDDAALMDDEASIDIIASVRRKVGNVWRDWEDSNITLKVNLREQVVEVHHDGKVIGKIPLNSEVPDAESFEGHDLDIEAEDQALEQAFEHVALEEIIQAMPVPDPILGCLIKGAVSTVVGQTIRCWRSARDYKENFAQMARSIAGCLREYGIRMAITFAYRAGKCAVML